MRRLLMITPVIVFVACSALSAKKVQNWNTGKVLDAQAVKSRAGMADIPEAIPTIRDSDLMILGNEFAYVIEDTRVSGRTSLVGLTECAIANRHHGCRFIVGDEVKYYQEKAVLHVIDVDGKECKTDILRQERLHSVSPDKK
jgi:hypothetical protein